MNRPMRQRRRLNRTLTSGFTSFQLTVVALLTIIAAGVFYLALREQPGERMLREADRMLVAQEENSPAKLRQVAAKTDVNNLFQALRLYKLDHGHYPSQGEGLSALLASPKPYLESLPVDPWGKPYQYANPGLKGEVDVFTAGADGVSRTPDDVGSWQP